MRYEVFADRVFFLHFGMNFLLLVLTAKLGGFRAAWKRLAVAAAAGSVFFVGVLLWPMGSFLAVRAAKAALMAAGTLAALYFAFGMDGRKSLKKGRKAVENVVRTTAEAAAFYAASACSLAGALAAISGIGDKMLQKDGRSLSGGISHAGTNSALHIFASALAAAAGGVWLIEKMRKRQKDPFWHAELKEGDKSVSVTALLDSGNSLFDPVSKSPVCIAEREVLERLGLLDRPEKFRLIPYHSIGKQHGLLRAAVLEEMYLQKGGQKQKKVRVLLAASDQPLSKSGRYQLLLHPALLEEEKGENHDIESSDAGKDAV